MSDNKTTTRDCDGCSDPKDSTVPLRTFLMQHGETETLCPECIGESHRLIVSEVDA